MIGDIQLGWCKVDSAAEIVRLRRLAVLIVEIVNGVLWYRYSMVRVLLFRYSVSVENRE